MVSSPRRNTFCVEGVSQVLKSTTREEGGGQEPLASWWSLFLIKFEFWWSLCALLFPGKKRSSALSLGSFIFPSMTKTLSQYPIISVTIYRQWFFPLSFFPASRQLLSPRNSAHDSPPKNHVCARQLRAWVAIEKRRIPRYVTDSRNERGRGRSK